jgi:hypothetical protein
MPKINALPSVFKGVTYRSRMEARWAVFMTEAKIPFFYEPEGYHLEDGAFYLPDFYLPNQDAFMEIKNPLAPEDSKKKPIALSRLTGKPVFVFEIPPTVPDWSHYDTEGATVYSPDYADCHQIWCCCPHCGRCEIKFDGRADRIYCSCPRSAHGDKGYNSDDPRLLRAYEVATAWRFEE